MKELSCCKQIHVILIALTIEITYCNYCLNQNKMVLCNFGMLNPKFKSVPLYHVGGLLQSYCKYMA